tara:strand:- start:1191 stop:1418 length:228 start_codon:yes stop_codon:yes gene_type:complete
MSETFMSQSSGTYIGYDTDGIPVAVATYGARAETRLSAEQFTSRDGLTSRHFEQGDPRLTPELERWANQMPIDAR